MKTVLFIILEVDSASGTCVLNVARQMRENGWNVDILSYYTNRIIQNNIRIHTIRPKFLIWLRKLFEKKILISNVLSLMYKAQIILTAFLWPLNAPLFIIRLYRRLKKLYEEYNYQIIIPVYTQLDPIIAGYFLKKNCDVKVVPYFLDSLSAGPIPKFLKECKKISKGLKWEEKLLKDMDAVIYMESSQKHHIVYSRNFSYYKKVVYLDIPMLTLDFINSGENNYLKSCKTGYDKKDNINSSSKKITVAYAGSLPKNIRNPEYAFMLLSKIKNVNLEINMVGVSENEANSICTYGLPINWLGKLPHEKAQEYLINADFLLNIGNKVEGMVPSKIFEYITLKRPIISFCPINNEPSIPYLKKYPMSCIIVEKDDIKSNINKVRKFLNHIPMCMIQDYELKKIYYKNTPECFQKFIETIVKNSIEKKGMCLDDKK